MFFSNIKSKYSSLPKSVKASIWFTFASLIQKGFGFIATPIYARLLTTEQYGVFSLYNSWVSIISIFATLNLSMGVLNNVLTKKEKFNSHDDNVLYNFQLLEIITISVVSALFLSFNFLLKDFFGISLRFSILVCLNIFFSSSVYLWSAEEKFNFRYTKLVLLTILVAFFTVGINILFIFCIDDKEYAIIFGTVVVLAVFYLPLLIRNIAKGCGKPNFKMWAYALRFNLPLIPHYLSMIILASSDKIMIERLLLSESAVALYSIPYSIASLSMVFILALNSSIVPTTYKRLNANNTEGYGAKINVCLLFFLFIVFFITLLGPEVVLLMGGDNYIDAISVIPPVSSSMFFMFLYPLFSNVEFFYEKRIMTMVSSIMAAVVNIILNFIFIRIYGYVAAAFTTLFCYFLMALFHFIFYKIIEKKKQIKGLFDTRMIIIFSCIALIIVPSSYLLYHFPIVRYIVLGTTLLVPLIFAKKIITMLKGVFYEHTQK